MKMTQATIKGKRVSLTIEEKARLLRVIADHPGLAENELAVTSGTARGCAYVVRHNGHHVEHCSCGAYCLMCSHALAAEWYLENIRANRRMMENGY